MQQIKLIAICGEAGSGKDALTRTLAQMDRGATFHTIINRTTRPIRENEVDGIHYHFTDDTTFLQEIKSNNILEYSCFNNWFYGTSIKDFNKDKINLGVFSPNAIKQLQQSDKISMKIFYIYTPAELRLIRQLTREENPNIKEIVRRYYADCEDFKFLSFPYITIENLDDLTKVAKRLADKIEQLTWD